MLAAYFQDKLGLYNGMMIEVLAGDQEDIKVRTALNRIDDDLLSLGLERPIAVSVGKKISFRGLADGMRQITMEGEVSECTKTTLEVTGIKVKTVIEKREYFRQKLDNVAVVRRLEDKDGEVHEDDKAVSCRVLDISATGIRILCRPQYEQGDRVELTKVCVASETMFAFKGTVRWCEETPGGMMYGCEFDELRPRVEDMLIQEIFALQNKSIQKERNRGRR